MNKLIASVSKKVPVPGVAYSNHQFAGGLEVEVPAGMSDGELRARFRQLYALLVETVEEEIAAAVAVGPADAGGRAEYPEREERRRVLSMPPARYPDAERVPSGDWGRDSREPSGYTEREREERRGDGFDRPSRDSGRARGRQDGGGRGGPATQAQIKAVFGIAKGRGVERSALMRRIHEQFGVRRVEDLNVREASSLIESLKAA